ncbi:MAG: hypothetical protein DRQ10_05350, partial [Candidatus Hydrothermota bacterium]
EETRVAKVTPEICEGCGICVAACPSHAAMLLEAPYGTDLRRVEIATVDFALKS